MTLKFQMKMNKANTQHASIKQLAVDSILKLSWVIEHRQTFDLALEMIR